MFDGFTGSARRALADAATQARRLRATQVSPEHLLLGLTENVHPSVARIFFNLGISARRLGQTVADLTPADHGGPGAEPSLSVDTRRVLAQARYESLRLGQRFIGPQHLLLGIVHEPATVAAQVLAQFGAGLTEVRAEVARLPLPLRVRIPWRWRYLRPRRRRPPPPTRRS